MKGIAVGGWVNPVVLLSNDGGLTWREQESGVDYIRPDSVHFYDANYGLAADSSGFGIIRTSNGGLNWVGSENTGSPQDVQLVSQSKAFVADFQQGVYVSTDGGATFSLSEAFSDTPLYGVHFVSNREGWVVGAKKVPGQLLYTGKILHTTNGGETWQVQRTDDSYLMAVHFVNRTRGWAVGGSGRILSTATGGITWTVQSVDTNYYLQDVDFVDESYGWTVGTRQDYGGQAKIWCTTDGGGHWQECGYYWVGEWPGDEAKFGIDFANRSVGYVVGKNKAGWGSVFKTTNGGDRWVEKPLGGNYPVLHGVYFLNANEGWVVGENGFIAHTRNGGDSWDVQSSGTTKGLCKVTFVDNLRGYATGDCYSHGMYGSIVLKTTNGGLRWAEETTGTRAGIMDVAFPDRYHAWIVGNDGMIRAYTDSNTPRREGWVPLVLRLR